MDQSDRMATWDAAKGRCVACGELLGSNGVVHHRQAKGMGGRKGARRRGLYSDRPPFTVVLHDGCHKLVHANPAAAYDAGLLVRSSRHPGDVPMGRLRLGGP